MRIAHGYGSSGLTSTARSLACAARPAGLIIQGIGSQDGDGRVVFHCGVPCVQPLRLMAGGDAQHRQAAAAQLPVPAGGFNQIAGRCPVTVVHRAVTGGAQFQLGLAVVLVWLWWLAASEHLAIVEWTGQWGDPESV